MFKTATASGVTRLFSGEKREMESGDGWPRWLVVVAALLLVLVPLLPFLAVAWVLSRTLRGVRERVSWD
jgi:type II secretory pathway component PulL